MAGLERTATAQRIVDRVWLMWLIRTKLEPLAASDRLIAQRQGQCIRDFGGKRSSMTSKLAARDAAELPPDTRKQPGRNLTYGLLEVKSLC
jgi:hypothetical protein